MKQVPVPLGSTLPAGSMLFQWLGSLWTSLMEDTRLVEQLQAASGLTITQLYIRFTELANLLDRTKLPVYARSAAMPLVLKASRRNADGAAPLVFDGRYDAVFGPQINYPLRQGSILTVGGSYDVVGVVSYPVDDARLVGASCIVDKLGSPTRVYVGGSDFVLADGYISFPSELDPVNAGFPVRSVLAADGTPDTEVQVWLLDAILDEDYVHDYAGYAIGLRRPTSEYYARAVNALWDLHNFIGSPARVQAGIAALLDEPVVLGSAETVVDIIGEDTDRKVITDLNVYDIPDSAILRRGVTIGSTLHMGDLLTQTVKVYDNLDPSSLGSGEYNGTIRADIPTISLPPSMFRARLRYGIGINWTRVPITYVGDDANGNPKLQFELIGDPADLAAFWSDFWSTCETQGISGETSFAGSLYTSVVRVPGATWGTVVPMEHFLSNFLKANMLVVSLDVDRLSEQGRIGMSELYRLGNLLPANVFFVTVRSRELDVSQHDLGEEVTGTLGTAYSRSVTEAADPDNGVTGLGYRAGRPVVRWIPNCRS